MAREGLFIVTRWLRAGSLAQKAAFYTLPRGRRSGAYPCCAPTSHALRDQREDENLGSHGLAFPG